MRSSESADDEGPPELSDYAKAALEEFLREREEQEKGTAPQEDWQLSQFWYSDETAAALANEALRAAGPEGAIACISCPTLYAKLRELGCKNTLKLLEFDRRFECHGEDFVHYDYNVPLEIPQDWQGKFTVVVLDPPFLSEECLSKTAETVQFLRPTFVILCTGAVMEPYAEQLLGLRPCNFEPTHTRKLGNEFKCFANYNLDEFCC
ncbi:EEF1A lysine methyltransferase 1 [Dermacentor albipictus]|uniref:EEF1A lysine methyltransferase 1 n=1 Tax=Dermacentor albipictus TaxID=60249 RepID=UPI0038FC232F